jgi:hypothetical protein
MEKNFHTPLEKQRFHVSPESRAHIRALEAGLKAVQSEYPEFKALTFFGSRILGKERDDSDIDAVLFCDVSALEERPERREVIENNSKQLFASIWEQEFENTEGGQRYHIQFADCSQENIDYATGFFVGEGDRPPSVGEPSELDYTVVAPFLLAVGNIYPVRRKILEAFEHEKKPEQWYKKLINRIEHFERVDSRKNIDDSRSTLSYGKFPQTLEKGKKYFLDKENLYK